MSILAGVAAGACVEGAWVLAMGWVALGALLAAGLRRDVWMKVADPPLALQIDADGSLAIVRRGGQERVTVAGSSLFLGSGALLVLTGPQTWRLFLGAGNVKPDQLAALRRLLRGLRA